MKKIELIPEDTYKVDGGYLFPFTVMDATPGGESFGRIMWTVEIFKSPKIKGRRTITQILVEANSTRDPRYAGKTFILECNTASILTRTLTQDNDFFRFVWQVGICEQHNKTFFSAYPGNMHRALLVEAYSGIGTRIVFLTEAEVTRLYPGVSL